MKASILVGDCRKRMAAMEPDSIDAIVCDPPYGLEFMGKEWDRLTYAGGNPSMKTGERPISDRGEGWQPGSAYGSRTKNPRCRNCGKLKRGNGCCKCPSPSWDTRTSEGGFQMQAWHESWAVEALRVAKPGAFLLAFGGDRTHHRLMCAIEDAGWEIRSTLCYLFGAGFPKSRNVSADLRAMPACECGRSQIPRHVGEHSGLPLGPVGAGVGAEPSSMGLTRSSTDQASGVGTERGPGAGGRKRQMERGVELGGRKDDQEVLGPMGMAGITEGDEVGIDVGRIERQPEPLRDDVVDDEPFDPSTVLADHVTVDDPRGDTDPVSSLVSPLTSAPRRIRRSTKPDPVVDSHTSPRAVDADLVETPELGAADLTGEAVRACVPSTHDAYYPTERDGLHVCDRCSRIIAATIPNGLGSALKPAVEFICMARKPLAGNLASNVQRFGTGALNIDASRIGMSDTDRAVVDSRSGRMDPAKSVEFLGALENGRTGDRFTSSSAGRWPANVLLSCCGNDPHDSDCAAAMLDRQSGERASGVGLKSNRTSDDWEGGMFHPLQTQSTGGDSGGASRFFFTSKASRADRNDGLEGMPEVHKAADNETIIERVHEPDKQVIAAYLRSWRERSGLSRAEVDERLGTATLYSWFEGRPKGIELPTPEMWLRLKSIIGFDDTHDLAMTETRVVSLAERDNRSQAGDLAMTRRLAGLAKKRANHHPTVKPTDLMRWLCKLITQPGGTILDPFCGSGSTGVAALAEGFNFIGIELSEEYAAIAEARIANVAPLFAEVETDKPEPEPDAQMGLGL